MGQSGSLILYTMRHADDPKDTLRAVLRLIEPEHVLAPFRSIGEDNEWEDFLKDGPGIRDEMFPRPASMEEFVSLYVEGLRLAVSFTGSRLAQRIMNAAASIPFSIRGDYLPTDASLRIGFHDLFDTAEHDEGRLIARPFLSISFFGYSTANNWNAFREAMFRIPEVRDVKRELEVITGPLEQCIIWSV